MMKPLVSIIIVNFNGRYLLEECLASVFKTNLTQDRFEVIVVDNNSSDDSVAFIKNNFPEVNLIESEDNLGFTGGNNLGFKHSRGKYIALLNSDTRVDPNWLSEMLKRIKGTKTGIVSPRIYLDTPFLELTIKSDTISKTELDGSADFTPLGVLMEKIQAETNHLNNLIWYESGFYKEKGIDIPTRWTKGEATVLLPFRTSKKTETFNFTFHGYKKKGLSECQVKLLLGDELVHQVTISPNKIAQVTLEIPQKLAKKHFQYLVQNTGNVVLGDGKGKDRGSILRIKHDKLYEFYDHDYPYYSKQTNLLAFCGAACLIKRRLIDQLHFFDGYYFMYYEDMDLSLRAWRSGWDIKYAPSAVVYHKHKATTGSAETGFFLHLVERNHLTFVLTHFPLKVFFVQLAILILRTFASMKQAFIFQFSSDNLKARAWEIKADARKETLRYIGKHFLRIYKNRLHWQREQVRGYKEMGEFVN